MTCKPDQVRLTVPVVAQHDDGASLSAYMALPVSQFVLIEVPLGARLERLGSNIFELVVPRLELLGLWLQPEIKCIVKSNAEAVKIQSISLHIEGSDIVHTLHVNERVDFSVTCIFTHTDGCQPAIHSDARIDALVDPPAPFSFAPDKFLSGTANAVLEASLAALLGAFVKSLAADYAQWARSKEYREDRIQHAISSDARFNI